MDDPIHKTSPDAEALATVPAENERRARLYDRLWQIAYGDGPVTISTVGGRDMAYQVTVHGRGVRGSLEKVEKWISEQGQEARND